MGGPLVSGGGGLSSGGGGPSMASAGGTSGFSSDFTVNFGGGRTSMVPWIVLGVVAVVFLWRRT
jgi:hypothetical protein